MLPGRLKIWYQLNITEFFDLIKIKTKKVSRVLIMSFQVTIFFQFLVEYTNLAIDGIAF